MKKRKNTTAFVLFLAALFLLLGFSSCSAPEPDPPLTDEEALRGQWALYAYPDVSSPEGAGSSDEPGATGETELEFGGIIIDIQYTLPGYWLMGGAFETEPTDPSEIDPYEIPYKITEITGGYFVKSNRTQSKEDGSFSVSYYISIEEGGYTIEYKFIDAERNTMEAKVMNSDGTVQDVCIMKRLIDHEIKVNMDLLVISGK